MAGLPHGHRHLGLVLLTKAPAPGLAKRRLGGQIGAEPAARIARLLLAHTVDACLAVGAPVHGFHHGPIDELPLHPGIAWRPSPGDDPVSAVLAAFRELARLYERLVAVPSDVPGMTCSYLAAADRVLHDVDVVLGPSRDGGLVLFGAACTLPDELGHLVSSSGRLYDDVLRCCTEHGLTVGTVPALTDIDTWWSISRAIDAGELGEDSVLHTHLLDAMRSTTARRAHQSRRRLSRRSGRGAAHELDDVRARAARHRPAGE
jgi:glycosyltransferase A (GT-A) superfamily protein (DUF2064 family)